MSLMDWSPALSVKVKQFDDQHIKLLNLVNELHDAMKTGKGKEVVGKTLSGLINYTATHFNDEERMLTTHAYPGLAAHKAEHAKLVKQVLELQQKVKTGEVMVTHEVMNFLKDWLMKHIQGDDKKYGIYLNSKGIS